MDVQERNSTLIYNLTNQPTLPSFLSDRARRNLSKTSPAIRRRINLLQDFEMPSVSQRILQSPDARYLFLSGIYKPRIRCFEVEECGMKFERGLDAEVVDMICLSDDYGKIGMLLGDRTLAFHAPYGAHDVVRLPKMGRAIGYEKSNCDLQVVGGQGEVWRFNLDEGRYRSSLKMGREDDNKVVGGDCIDISECHPLTAVGCEDGIVRFYDNRAEERCVKSFVSLDVERGTKGYGFQDDDDNLNGKRGRVTSVKFHPNGIQMAAGTYGGNVAVYDMRSSKPLHVKEHQYGLPIHTIAFHPSGSILTSDPKVIKLWNPNDGQIVANIEGTADINHFVVAGPNHESGLILCATEQPKPQIFFCPKLGPAPKWCSFLENVTEELEERDLNEESNDTTTVFDDYKFVTREEVEQLGVENLVGTPLLRGYMHGFFMNVGLYHRVRAVANPFEYETYRKDKIKKKIQEKRASRISSSSGKQKVKINQDLVDKLHNKKGKKVEKELLKDDRFGQLFENPDFEIDYEADDYKLRNPTGNGLKKRSDDVDSDGEDEDDEEEEEAGFQKVDEESWGNEEEDEEGEMELEEESDSDEDGFAGAKVRGENYQQLRAIQKQQQQKQKHIKPKKRKPTMTLYEANDYGDAQSNAINIGVGDSSAREVARKRNQQMKLTLEERMKSYKEDVTGKTIDNMKKIRGTDGMAREMKYIPNDVRKKMEQQKQKEMEEGERRGKRNRRGVKELGFKTPFRNQR